jgi:RND superfamily putative drug exporter
MPAEHRTIETSERSGRPNLTARAARWSAAHRRAAVLGWFAFVLIAFAVGSTTGLVFLKDDEVGIGDSNRAEKVLARDFPTERAGERVLIQSRTASLDRAELRAAVVDLAHRLSQVRDVAAVQSPLSSRNAGQLSRDGRSALLTFQIAGDPASAPDRVGGALAATAAVQRAHRDLLIGELGDASIQKAMSDRLAQDFQQAEVTSLPVTLVILVLAFGALVAAGIPLLLGLTAVMGTLGLTALISHLLHMDESINSVILLIGLAVGVDYSLFYLRRYREERAKGRAPDTALDVTAATSGRAVLVSGLTVMTAMAGMFFMGNRVFQGFGVGTVLVVAVALVGSLTVLPAVISKLGDRLDRGRVPFLGRLAADESESPVWGRIVAGVLRRPVVSGVLAAALLVVLAIPAFQLHTVNSGAQGLPPEMPIVKLYDRAQAAFPGGPLPAIVAISASDVTAPKIAAGIDALKRGALATGRIREPISVEISPSHHAARVLMPLTGTGTDSASNRALDALRSTVIPSTIARVSGAQAHVTGPTAMSRDFNDSMKSHAPFVFAFVLGLAFLLLLVTFRSIVIPIKAIVLNLLSVGASYGVLVLVFQDGRLESLLNFQSFGGITTWLPLFLFVVLFGLSMDYHVLILTRVREHYDAGMSTERAVYHGIRTTAGVVTSAAIVMVGVFAIFATLGWVDFKMMGVGLAVAVLLDATIVRAVLLPATMKLLGDWNWYLPHWLEWLPRVSHDEQSEVDPATQPAPRIPIHA